MPLVAKVEEELAARRLDLLLRLGEVVDLKAEMIGADGVFRVRQVVALAAGEVRAAPC